MEFKKEYLLLIIIVIAIFLRMFGSGLYEHPDFFSDELGRISAGKYMTELGQPVLWQDMDGLNVLHFSHPPFDKLAYASFVALVGDGFLVRLFPIGAGILTILLTFYLAKTLFNRNIGIIAALLLAVSRYHIYGSQLIDVDGSFLPLFSIAAILFFVLYKKKSYIYRSAFAARQYLLVSMLFFGLCIFTKLLGVLIIVPILIYSVYFDRSKRNFLTKDRGLIKKKHVIELGYFVFSAILVLLLILSLAMAYGDMGWFNGPFDVLLNSASGTANASLTTTLQNKAFSLSAIVWQLTPFLAVLGLLALIFVKKNEKYFLLVSWILFLLAIFLIPVHGDVQRYFTMALPAVFILVAKLIYDVYKEIEERDMINLGICSVIGFAVVAFFDVNDLMGYYEIIVPIVLIVSAVGIGLLFVKNNWRKLSVLLLVAGFISMSLFAVVGTNSWIGIGTYTVHELAEGVKEQGWPYDEVWAWEDTIYQITPKDKIMVSKRPELNTEFVRKNNVKYIAVHTLRDETLFRNFAKNCRISEFIEVNGHVTGLLCEI